jgi:ribosomal protein L11 methyltransferase
VLNVALGKQAAQVTTGQSHGWRLTLELTRAVFDDIADTLEPEADAMLAESLGTVPLARDAADDPLRVTLFGTGTLAEDPRPARLRGLLGRAGVISGDITVEPVLENDWGKASLASFETMIVGRFAIHGSHQPAPPGRIGLRLDAGAAFGSGRHETTQGCLRALERVARRRQVRVALDIGTGSGILAVAMAKLWPARIVAVDNDPVAVETARETVRHNNRSNRVTLAESDGFRAVRQLSRSRADLVCANILARPLARMAPTFARHVRRSGIVVLSGILASEERIVLGRFRAGGFRLCERISLGAWVTLMLTR